MSNILTFSQAFKRKYPAESKYILKKLKAYNEGIEPDWKDFKKLFLLNWVRFLKSQPKLCQNSARTYCAKISSLLSDYSDEVNLPYKDFADILYIKKEDTFNIYLTVDEINRLLKYKPKTDLEHSVLNQFLLTCFTGMRRSDVIHFVIEKIHGSQVIYLAKKTKTLVRSSNSEITLKLIAEGMTMKCSDVEYNNTIRDICKNVGINDIVVVYKAGKELTGEKWLFVTGHTGRRTFATLWFLFCNNLFQVCQMMGHKDVKTTMGYICCDYTQHDNTKEFYKQFVMEEVSECL